MLIDLVVKFNEINIEPLNEAFGQDVETMKAITTTEPLNETSKEPYEKSAALLSGDILDLRREYPSKSSPLEGLPFIPDKRAAKEIMDDIETIVAREVEQGKCATFKRVEIANEKRSINEPKYTPVRRMLFEQNLMID